MRHSQRRRSGAATTAFLRYIITGLLATLLLQGCASPPLRDTPLPAELSSKAQIPGIPHARYWGDERPAGLDAWLTLSAQDLNARYGGIMHRPHNYLVISGGGSDGAFGAGLLVGWTERGDRPEFQIVTGISTGALIAPFAFLGPDYDDALREVYTTLSSRDLVETRNVFQIVRGDAAMGSTPLRGLIASYFDADFIAAVAAEGRRGRSLLIGTTNLDAARPVIWDITRMAASDAPGAHDLIRDVILASASIPGAFPPVLIEVEAEGRRYDEMHVDGGVTAQLFLPTAGIDWTVIRERLHVQGRPNLYLIRNSQLVQPWDTVEPRLLPIVRRTISTLLKSQGVGDLAKVYIAAEEHGLDYHLAFVPKEFSAESTETFDPAYMRTLFDLGRTMARDGYPWTVVGKDTTAE